MAVTLDVHMKPATVMQMIAGVEGRKIAEASSNYDLTAEDLHRAVDRFEHDTDTPGPDGLIATLESAWGQSPESAFQAFHEKMHEETDGDFSRSWVLSTKWVVVPKPRESGCLFVLVKLPGLYGKHAEEMYECIYYNPCMDTKHVEWTHNGSRADAEERWGKMSA